MKKNFEKGITLIALVITIILLLILAGVTLNLALNGGLIEKSQTAVDKYSEEQAKEKLILDISEFKMGKITGEYSDFKEYIESIKDGTVEVDTENNKYKVTIYGYEFILDKDTLEIEGGNKGENQIPVTPQPPQEPEVTATPIITGGDNIEGTEHGTITGGEYAYNNPVIPAGFKISTEGASWTSTNGTTIDGWNDGLVIQDESGNQFVWVPIHNNDVVENGLTIKAVPYTKWTSTVNGDPTATNTTDDTSVMPSDETAQITKYQGFYIGRYEAGIPTTLTTAISTASKDERNVEGTPIIKQNQVPWNFIDYTKASANAKKVCEATNIKSGLITGKMWDATMKWLENSEVNVQKDSKAWGNYSDVEVTEITKYSPYGNYGASWTSVSSTKKPTKGSTNVDYIWLLKTGHTEYTNRKNIYDLAGNLWEWTAEVYSSYRVRRGGNYINSSIERPAAYRNYYTVDDGTGGLGFRVALFVQ